MAFEIPTYDELRLAFVAVWRSLRPLADTGKGSDVDVESRSVSHLVDGLHSHVLQAVKALFAHLSWGPWLDYWLYLLGQQDGSGGYGRIEADTSSGEGALQVTCVSGTPTVDSGDELQDAAGRTYRPDESYAFPGAGTYDFDVVSVDTGLATNLESGATLWFVSPPAGIQQEATLVADLDGGRDRQTESEGRSAAVDYLRNPAMGGNWPEWIRLIEAALPNTLTGYLWYGRNAYPYGWGNVDLCWIQRGESGDARVSTLAQNTAVQAYIEARAPAVMVKNLRYLSVQNDPQTVKCTYTLADGSDDQYHADWDAYNNQRTITVEDSTKKLITVGVAYGSGKLSTGDRVIIAGEEVSVAYPPGDAHADIGGSYSKFIVDSWPWSVDLAADGPGGSGFQVLAGGGIAKVVFDAIRDYLNSVGPARGQGTAAPKDAWQDRFVISLIESAASVAISGQGAAPVDFVTTINAATLDITPDYNSTGFVPLLTFDEIQLYEDQD